VEYEVHVCANSPSILQSKWTVVKFDTKPIKYETIEWNFSDTEFDLVPATIPKDSSYTVRGLKIIGGANMVRDTKAPAKFGEISFSKRINTGGASTYNPDDSKANVRLLYISDTVTKAGVLEVYAQSNHETENRVLQVLTKDGKVERELATPLSKAAEVGDLRMPCSEKTEYYISGKASINIYMVRLLVGAIFEVDTVSAPKSLAVNGETLAPAFHPDTLNYTVNVHNTTKEIKITAEKNSGQTIEGDGTKTLTLGTTATPVYVDEFFVKVTAEDGEHTKVYSIRVNRDSAASSNAMLRSLKLDKDTFSPAFDPNVTDYTLNVDYVVDKVKLTAEAADAVATVGGDNGKDVPLKVGTNKLSVVVLAEDKTAKIYTLTVTRADKSTDAKLSNLTVSKGVLAPAFSANTLTYTDSVNYSEEGDLTITPVTSSKYATVTPPAAIPLATLTPLTPQVVTITVKAEDSVTTQTYTVTVVRRAEGKDVTPSEPPAPPAGVDKWWNFSDDVFKTALSSGDIVTETLVGEITFIGASGKAISYDGSKKSMDDYTFTQRVKLGGDGSPTSARAVKFDVTGSCTITVYAMSSSGSGSDRTLVVSDGTTQVGTISAPSTVLNEGTGNGSVTYTGGAGNIYLYSGGSGINLYGVKVKY
jgi:hypothetical protein